MPTKAEFFDQSCDAPFLYDERNEVRGWGWVAPEGTKAVGALTVIPRVTMPDRLGGFQERARIELVGAHRSGIAESLLKEAMSYFESRGMKLYRRGYASEKGLELMKKLEILVDPAVVFERACTTGSEPDYENQDSWGANFPTDEAKAARDELLLEATRVLRLRLAGEI